MSELDEALKAFLGESREGLDRLEEDVVVLEKAPGDSTRIASIFRTVHTIKGTCGFFGFSRLEQLTHAAEDVLALLRDGQLAFDAELTGALLALVDAVRRMLAAIEQQGNDGNDDHAALVQAFHRLRAGEKTTASALPEAGGDDDGERGSSAETAIRVDVDLLDKLMNVAGELVLTRNQILQHVSAQNDTMLSSITQRLSVITGELQEGVMRTRMQPISTLWSSFPRLVRDLEQHTGKRVQLLREGGDTELDRSLLQAIKDPLTHLLRNAVDHGLETPALRLAAGKPEAGLLRCSASHESGYVVIEISDDGAGIDPRAVREKAVARGLVGAEQAAALSERDVLDFIFQPGFSTAATVTSLSGRGVGLDVVRSNVSRIGGSIDLQTWPGRGSTFRLKIPLTLAIIPAVVISCRQERYAVPQINILEIVRLEAEEVADQIQAVHDALVYRLRGKLLPLVDLRALLKLPPRDAQSACFILVLNADGHDYGLVVDSVRDTEEIVVKPLGRHFKATPLYAGATIMGDGRIALILDALAIAREARVFSQERRLQRQREADTAGTAASAMRNALLLVRLGAEGRGAIPLGWVQRLEELPATRIEQSSRGEMVQYRGHILPLLRLNRLLQLPAAADGDTLHVVVHESRDGLLGLVVDAILDVAEEEAAAVRPDSATAMTRGLAVIQGRVTELIDMDAVLQARHTLPARTPALEAAHE